MTGFQPKTRKSGARNSVEAFSETEAKDTNFPECSQMQVPQQSEDCPKHLRTLRKIWRWRADSNRCRRFCRPLPGHLATPPCRAEAVNLTQERKIVNNDPLLLAIDSICLEPKVVHVA